MKNHLKFVLAIFLTVVITDMNAQIKSGYVFGLNLSTMTLNIKGLSSKPKTPAGVHFGAVYEIPLKGNFAFQPGLLFSAKGSDYKVDSIDMSLSPIYIEIPLMAVFSFGSDAVKISILAGPYFACGIGGYKIESGSDFKNLTYGSGGNHDLRPFDIGFNFGAGVNIRGFLISAQYGIGLLNLSPLTTGDSEMKNKVIGISITSLFARK